MRFNDIQGKLKTVLRWGARRLRWCALGFCVTVALCSSSRGLASLWPNQAEQYERQLQSDLVSVRLKAVQDLARTSPSLARSGITRALLDSDAQVRKRAAAVALLFEYEGLGSEVTEWLQSRDPQERSLAVNLMGLGVSSENLAQMGPLLTDQEPEVRVAVARTLGTVPEAFSTQAVAFLISGLDDPEPRVRLEVAASLGKVGDSSSALAVAAHLQDPEADVRVQLVLALGVLGNAAVVPSLLISLADPDDAVVTAAAQSLGQLDAEAAVPGLVAVLERSPFNEPGRRAAEALAALGTEAAMFELLNQLERPDARDYVVSLVEKFGQGALPGLSGCLVGAVGAELLACLELREHFGGDSKLRLQMVDEGRLSVALALSASDSFPDSQLAIFALEKLAVGEPAEKLVALAFLEQAESLPPEATRPLREALAKFPWSASDTVRLLNVIALCENAGLSAELLPFLKATDPLILAAAASAVVGQGLEGAALVELLEDLRPEVVEGAIRQLRRGQTLNQAGVIIELLAQGKTGRRTLLQSTLIALPEGLSSAQLEPIFALLEKSADSDRDALLSAFSRNGEITRLLSLARQGSMADRFKLAQLSFYHPQGGRLAAELLGVKSSRLSAMAALALGRRGEQLHVARVAELAEPKNGRPRYVQAAALQSLRWLHERSIAVPAEVLSKAVCTSEHGVLQIRALELAAALGKPCPGTSPQVLLASSSNARVREAAARTLRGLPEFSHSLRRCATYETRAEVAEVCRAPGLTTVEEALPEAVLPFDEIEVHTPFEADAAALTPVTFSFQEEIIVYVTDRRGRVLVPSEGVRAADLLWAY